MNKHPLAKPYGQSDTVFLVSRESICIWYIFRLAFRSLSDVSYSDECRTKKVLSLCEKNVSAFSCNCKFCSTNRLFMCFNSSISLILTYSQDWDLILSSLVPYCNFIFIFCSFCEILIQFSACSFGDHTFSNYLLIPLQQKHDVKYRKAIWGEHCDALKCFSMPIKSVS